jgi:hypothetical protein
MNECRCCKKSDCPCPQACGLSEQEGGDNIVLILAALICALTAVVMVWL